MASCTPFRSGNVLPSRVPSTFRPCVPHLRRCALCTATATSPRWNFWRPAKYVQESSELFQLLKTSKGDAAEVARIKELVQTLSQSEQPIQESKLGGGIWYFEGAAAWQFWSAPGKLAGSKNRAGQDLDPRALSVINYAEIAGPSCYITAQGRFKVKESSTNLYEATVEGGTLHLGERTINLPFIQGSGTFQIKYLDYRIRIFLNPGGALAVQVLGSALDA